MADYDINKGIGAQVEFKGLKAQYLFIFAAGLLSIFILFVVLYMAGVDTYSSIAFGVVSALVLVRLTFRLNARYGSYGLMKLAARKRQPRRIIHRKRLARLLARIGES